MAFVCAVIFPGRDRRRVAGLPAAHPQGSVSSVPEMALHRPRTEKTDRSVSTSMTREVMLICQDAHHEICLLVLLSCCT